MVINDLYLLVAPAAGVRYDQAEEDKSALAAKRERLAKGEALNALKSGINSIPEDATKKQGLFRAWATKIFNNVQVTVKNIHVRYEDNVNLPDHPFAAGVTLAGFTAETTDESWVPRFIAGTSNVVIRKVSAL